MKQRLASAIAPKYFGVDSPFNLMRTETEFDTSNRAQPIAPVADSPVVAERGRKTQWRRALLFVLSTVALWMLYFAWRPPLAMLQLSHTEHLKSGSGQIAMSFDDAPHPVITPLLLAALKRADARASFFVIGDSLRFYPELAHRIVAEGHALANHSRSHINLTHVAARDYDREVASCFVDIERVDQSALALRSHLFRPPGGGLDRDVMEYLLKQNIRLAWWSNNVGDWARPPAWKIATQVNAHLREGDIILLHDTPGGYGTPQAVPAIVRAARLKNLSVVPMPED